MTAKQRLLNDNTKALQFLHTASGFDFQEPHEIIYHEGNYTINAMCKQIENANNKIIVLLVQYSNRDGRKLAFVPIINGKADPIRQFNIRIRVVIFRY